MSKRDFKNNSKEEIAELKFLAEQGDASAQFSIGWIYENGKSVKKDSKEAIKWYRKAAHQGVGEAQLRLAIMYARGVGIGRNYKKAKAYCYKAAKNGYLNEANYYLGFIFEEEGRFEKASEFYRKSDTRKYARAQYNLFKTYTEIGQVNLAKEVVLLRMRKATKNLKLLSKRYLIEFPREWKKEYPDEFFELLDKLFEHEKTTSNNRPWYYGGFINIYIYNPMISGEILRKLVKLNSSDDGIRKHRHHQFFREGPGLKILRDKIDKIISIMKISSNMKDFKRRYNKWESGQGLFSFINDEEQED